MPSRLPTTTDARAAHLRAQGAAIADARHAAGVTQLGLAEWLGVSLWTVRGWEQGKSAAPAEVRRRVLAELGGDAALLGPEGDACPCCRREW